MKRRDFLAFAGVAGAAAAFPRVAFAQQVAKVPRIAFFSIPQPAQYLQALQQGLADYGYVDDKTITIEPFTAATNNDLSVVGAQAVASKPDIILSLGTPASQAAKTATSTIPIVFSIVADPTGAGLVANIVHPGGNITGDTNQAPGLVGKQLSIIKEIAPTVTRLVILNVPSDASSVLQNQQAQDSAKALGIEAMMVDFADGQDLATQFQPVAAAGAQFAYAPTNTYFNGNRDLLFDLFLKSKLAAMTGAVVEGAATPFIGVVTYGPSNTAVVRHSASFVDAILKGAKPGDLPVEQPTMFELAVNLDTARKIGITIPASILAQATLVVDEDWRAPKVAK